MPPIRRRRVGAGAPNISLGSLLADADRERRLRLEEEALATREQERAEAETQRSAEIAKRDARQAASDRSRLYNSIIKDYVEGNANFALTLEALQNALKTEEDAELKEFLRSYITTAKTTKMGREISAKIKGYNEGTTSYGDLVTFLQEVDTENEVVKESISSALATARQSENSRIQNKLTSDYNAGRVDVDQYISGLTELRDANQTNPVEMERLTQSIEEGRQLKRDLSDQQTYSRWQTGQISDGEAMTYFQGRSSTSTNPKDAANVSRFLSNVQQFVKQRGSSNAAAYDKAAKDYAQNTMKRYAEEYLDPAIEACAGDPACVMGAYDNYGKAMTKISGIAGSDGQYWQQQAALAGNYGLQRAAVEQYNKLKEQIEDIKLDDRDTPEQLLQKAGQRALLALEGRESQYQTDQAKIEFNRFMAESADAVIVAEREAIRKATEENEQLDAELQGAYDDVRRGATPQDKKRFNDQFKITFDATPEDFATFGNWMMADPGKNAAIIYSLARPLKPGDKIPTDEASDKFADDFIRLADSPVVREAEKLLTGFIQLTNPGTNLSDAQHVGRLIRALDATTGTDPSVNRRLTTQLLFEAQMVKGLQDIDQEIEMLAMRRRTQAQRPVDQIDWLAFDEGAITKPKTPEDLAMEQRREEALGLGRFGEVPTPKTDPLLDLVRGVGGAIGGLLEKPPFTTGTTVTGRPGDQRREAERIRESKDFVTDIPKFERFEQQRLGRAGAEDIPRFEAPIQPRFPTTNLGRIEQDLDIPRFQPFDFGPRPAVSAPQTPREDDFNLGPVLTEF